MFGLPDNTYFGKLVPKNKFYDKLTIDKKLERSFIDQINSIRWAHKLSADTLNVEKGSTVEEVEVLIFRKNFQRLLDDNFGFGARIQNVCIHEKFTVPKFSSV